MTSTPSKHSLLAVLWLEHITVDNQQIASLSCEDRQGVVPWIKEAVDAVIVLGLLPPLHEKGTFSPVVGCLQLDRGDDVTQAMQR